MREIFARFAARPLIAAELAAASLFANVLALASPLFVIQVLNRYVAHGVDTTLATLTAGVVVAVLFELGFRHVRLALASAVNAPIDRRVADGAFQLLSGAKTAAIEQLSPGVRREVMSGTDTLQSAYSAPNVAAILDVPFALVFVGAIYLLSPMLAVMTGVFIAAVFLMTIGVLFAARGLTRELSQASARRNGLIAGAIGAADTVRAFNGASFLRRLWAEEALGAGALQRRIMARQGLLQSLTQSAQALLGVGVIAIGATLVVGGKLDVGSLMGVNILAARALGPFARLAQLVEGFAKARQAAANLREFTRLPQERSEGPRLSEYKGGLELKDVGFTHPGATTPLFEHLSFVLAPGSILVVTGGNGTGKTTLARLLVKLLDPSRGQILVDGVDLAQLTPGWWRNQVIYMPQEPRFLNACIKDNLLAFKPSLDEAGIARLIDAAGLRQFINQTPAGIELAIQNNGDSLPVGIRRRLALARALATDGMLAVLDEPTEGLDRDGAAALYRVMNALGDRGRTIVAFSHDPYILKGAKRVIDLNVKPVPRVLDVAQMTEALRDKAGARAGGVPDGPFKEAAQS
ncbi:MAG: ATP-binding cassette domain-containing protein [Rhodospirillales bacterium]|nr:ATP-binding cassette domain-containing protein [Rhodospirillales bacterium]